MLLLSWCWPQEQTEQTEETEDWGLVTFAADNNLALEALFLSPGVLINKGTQSHITHLVHHYHERSQWNRPEPTQWHKESGEQVFVPPRTIRELKMLAEEDQRLNLPPPPSPFFFFFAALNNLTHSPPTVIFDLCFFLTPHPLSSPFSNVSPQVLYHMFSLQTHSVSLLLLFSVSQFPPTEKHLTNLSLLNFWYRLSLWKKKRKGNMHEHTQCIV